MGVMLRILIIPLALLGMLLGAMVWSGGGVEKRADFAFINRGDIYTLDINQMSYMQDFRLTYGIREGLYSPHPETMRPIPAGATESRPLRRQEDLDLPPPQGGSLEQRRPRHRPRLRLLLAPHARGARRVHLPLRLHPQRQGRTRRVTPRASRSTSRPSASRPSTTPRSASRSTTPCRTCWS